MIFCSNYLSSMSMLRDIYTMLPSFCYCWNYACSFRFKSIINLKYLLKPWFLWHKLRRSEDKVQKTTSGSNSSERVFISDATRDHELINALFLRPDARSSHPAAASSEALQLNYDARRINPWWSPLPCRHCCPFLIGVRVRHSLDGQTFNVTISPAGAEGFVGSKQSVPITPCILAWLRWSRVKVLTMQCPCISVVSSH